MDISIMTVSIPLDGDTMQEVKELLEEDTVNYESLLSVEELTDFHLKGFCVLAYDDESDKLVGVLSCHRPTRNGRLRVECGCFTFYSQTRNWNGACSRS